MILINMMMAIINMAFEEIKSQSEAYKNKFEIMEYIKRSTRELTGLRWIIILHFENLAFLLHRAAVRELPKYKKETGDDNDENGGQEDDGEKKPLSDEFSEKTNQLLDYIEKTYLQGVIEDDPQGKNIIEKMRLDNTQKVGYIRKQKDVVY